MFGEGALGFPHHILSQAPKRLTGPLGPGEGLLFNPPNIICYLNSQTGNSSLYRGSGRALPGLKSHSTGGSSSVSPKCFFPSHLFNFNFYLDEAFPA